MGGLALSKEWMGCGVRESWGWEAGEGEWTGIVCKIKMIVLKVFFKRVKKSVETWYSQAQVTWEFLHWGMKKERQTQQGSKSFG